MYKIVHDVTTGQAELVPMTAEEVAARQAEVIVYEQEKAAEEAKPTPQKDLLARAAAAKTVEELRGIVAELIGLVYGLPVDDRAQPVDETTEGQLP